MADAIAGTEKRSRGRPPTFRTAVTAKLTPEELSALDSWRSKHPEKPNRPEAIRMMIGQVTAPDEPISPERMAAITKEAVRGLQQNARFMVQLGPTASKPGERLKVPKSKPK